MTTKPTEETAFIQTDIKKPRKIEVKRESVKIRSSLQKARAEYETAEKLHTQAVRAARLTLFTELRKAWRDYRTTRQQHLILKNQAANIYKLAALQEKAGK